MWSKRRLAIAAIAALCLYVGSFLLFQAFPHEFSLAHRDDPQHYVVTFTDNVEVHSALRRFYWPLIRVMPGHRYIPLVTRSSAFGKLTNTGRLGRAPPNQVLHLTAAADSIFRVLLSPAATAGELWRSARRRSRVVRFTANTVVVDDSDEEFILVGFADEQGGAYREALHFQRSHEFDGQDVALGMDSVYAERNDQSQGGYGGVERVELHSGRVRVVVRGEVAERMGTTEFDIAFALPPAEFQRLRDGLRVVFAGFGSLVEYPAEPSAAADRGGM